MVDSTYRQGANYALYCIAKQFGVESFDIREKKSGIEEKAAELAQRIMEGLREMDGKPVAHGRWIEHSNEYENYCECSVCHCSPDAPLDITNYCPNCGAKMNLEEAP